jgi:hypothetical protein
MQNQGDTTQPESSVKARKIVRRKPFQRSLALEDVYLPPIPPASDWVQAPLFSQRKTKGKKCS